MKLEERLARLDVLVGELESGQLDLADALERFEEGVTHLREAAAALGRAEVRVKHLTELADGAFVIRDDVADE